MAKDLKLSIVIGLKDRATKGLKAIGGQVKSFSSGLTASLGSSNKLFGAIARGIDGVGLVATAVAPELSIPFMLLGTAAKAALAGVSALGGVIGSVFKAAGSVVSTVIGKLEQVAQKAFAASKMLLLVGAGLAEEAIRRSINAFADYNQAITNAGTATGLMGAELDKAKAELTEFGLAISRHLALLPKEIATGFYGLASAGLSVNEVMKASPGILTLAEGTMNDIASTTELVVGAVKSFQLGFTQTNRVVNAFAASIGASMLNMQRLAVSFPYVAASAANLGIPLEQIIATLGVVVDRGIDASMAGSGLRMVFQHLLNPTNEARKALAKYGLTAEDVNIATKGFLPVLARLQAANISLADAYKIFEARAANAFQVLMSAGVPAISALERKITGTNRAFEMQEQQISTAQGVWNILKSTISELSIRFGQALAPAFKTAAQWLQKMTEYVIKLKVAERAGAWIASLANAVMAAFTPVAATVGEAEGAVSRFGRAMSAIAGVAGKSFGLPDGKQSEGAASGFELVTASVRGLLTALGKSFGLPDGKQSEGAASGFALVTASVRGLLTALGALGQAVAASFGGMVGEAGSGLVGVFVNIVNGIAAAVTWLTDNVFAPGRIAGIVAWLKELANVAINFAGLIVAGIQYGMVQLGGIQGLVAQIGGYFQWLLAWGKYLVGWVYTNLPNMLSVVGSTFAAIANAILNLVEVGLYLKATWGVIFHALGMVVTGAATVVGAALLTIGKVLEGLFWGLSKIPGLADIYAPVKDGMKQANDAILAFTQAAGLETDRHMKQIVSSVTDASRDIGRIKLAKQANEKFGAWTQKQAEDMRKTQASWGLQVAPKPGELKSYLPPDMAPTAGAQQAGINFRTQLERTSASVQALGTPAMQYGGTGMAQPATQVTNNYYVQGNGDTFLLGKIRELTDQQRREDRWAPA